MGCSFGRSVDVPGIIRSDELVGVDVVANENTIDRIGARFEYA